MRKQTNTSPSPSPKGFQSPKFSDSDFRESADSDSDSDVRKALTHTLPDEINGWGSAFFCNMFLIFNNLSDHCVLSSLVGSSYNSYAARDFPWWTTWVCLGRNQLFLAPTWRSTKISWSFKNQLIQDNSWVEIHGIDRFWGGRTVFFPGGLLCKNLP
jgi:hypothetical protein